MIFIQFGYNAQKMDLDWTKKKKDFFSFFAREKNIIFLFFFQSIQI